MIFAKKKQFYIIYLLIILVFELRSSKDIFKSKNINNSTVYLNKNEINFNTSIFWNYTYIKNEMHSYGLYHAFLKPKITFILMRNKTFINNAPEIIEKIPFLNDSMIEIILLTENKSKEDNIFKKKLDKEYINKNIIKFCNKQNNSYIDFYNIINLINGDFAIFIDNIKILKILKIENLLNLSRRIIDNYCYINISNEYNIYILKSKILKNFIDNGVKINSLEILLNLVMELPEPQLNYIPISLCPDDYYTNLAYVAMSSILNSKSINTFICFYLIVPYKFKNENINFLNSLYEKYNLFNITFIRMDNRYDNAYSDKRMTKPTYYRCSLGELLPNLNKIIYIDPDIIAYKDFNNFYNLNFNGKMILGHPTIGNRNTLKLGYLRINAGILLLNLYEMRKNNFEKKVLGIIKKVKKLQHHDQTILNDFFRPYIGLLPPEYHARPWSSYKEIEIFNYKIGNIYDTDYYYFTHKYPTIRHFFGDYKPKNFNINFIEDWWFFARQSKYYNCNSSSFISAFS